MPEGGRAGSAWRPERLTDSRAFRRTFREGKRYRGERLKAAIAENSLGALRLGFSISAKKGNAVRRNLLRRRVRCLAQEFWPNAGVDIVVWPAVDLREIGLRDTKAEMERIGRKIAEVAEKSGPGSD
mgnify:CR=1 FL=1